MPEYFDVLIVGAGHAGANLALALRQRKFAGTVGVIGDELGLPYDRPPLSKGYLAGAMDLRQLMLRPEFVWDAQTVQFRFGHKVRAVDAGAHAVELDCGTQIGYGRLVWAAGGRARRLVCPGANLGGIHSIRSRIDVDRLRSELESSRDVVIVGGGYIGLEAAATLVTMGKVITVLEAQPRLLGRMSGPPVSEFLARKHAAEGVNLKLATSVQEILGEAGRVKAVRLDDGSVLPADIVIAGVGLEPNIEPLAEAGAVTSNGVHIDAQCRTSLQDVLAVGDCTWHPNRYSATGWARLESVPNALDQATVAAKVLAGESATLDSVPWFWSDQYDIKLQTAGLSGGYDDVVVRGDTHAGSFSVVYRRAGRVVALDCVNSPRDFVHGKLLIGRGVAADLHSLASVPELKSLVPCEPLRPQTVCEPC